MTDKAAYVYCITNMLNGMQYIGVTVDPQKRFRSHCRPVAHSRLLLKNAILKYGKEHFKMEVLLKASQSYCYRLEQKVIALYNTLKPNGYNITKGGMGSLGLVGEMNGCFGRTGASHPNFGKCGYRTGIPHTEETKAKMSKSRTGRKNSPEVIEKMKASAKIRWERDKEKLIAAGFGIGKKKT